MARLKDLAGGRGIFRGPIFKGQFVDEPSAGEPYVSARDIVNTDVIPSTYLSRKHGRLLEDLRLREGMILVTCSGMNLGRAVWARSGFQHLVASGDLIRIQVNQAVTPPGYVYAFLASRYGHSQIRKQIYGGHIKHVDPDHLEELLIPRLGASLERQIHDLVEGASTLRVKASQDLKSVATTFDAFAYDLLSVPRATPRISVANAESIQPRFDAQFHDPLVRDLRKRLTSSNHSTIASWCNRIFLPGIFKRIHADDPVHGAPYYTGSALFTLNPEPKGILSRRTSLFDDVRMEENTVLVQAFGQEGGLTGRAVWIGRHLSGATTTHMLVRLAAPTKRDTAYLFGFLQSQSAYRQIASLTYGGSIPHFDEAGISTVVLPILSDEECVDISRKVISAVENRDDALAMERSALALVEQAIEGRH